MRVNARQWQPLSGSSYARRREGGFRAALFLWEARCRSALCLREDRRAPLETNCESSCYYARERDGPVARTP